MAQEMTDERPFQQLIFTIPFPHTLPPPKFIPVSEWSICMYMYKLLFTHREAVHTRVI